MDLERFDIKLFVSDPDTVVWTDYTEIFTRWRDEDRERWLDIADYVHMSGGPGLLLVGKDVHIGMDNRHERPGLLYSRREPFSGTSRERTAEGLREALEFAAKLEREQSVRFDTASLDFIVNDRVQFPNDERAFSALRDDLASGLDDVFGGPPDELVQDPSPSERLTVHVRFRENRSVAQVLDDLVVRV
jgi:hypothetical protein